MIIFNLVEIRWLGSKKAKIKKELLEKGGMKAIGYCRRLYPNKSLKECLEYVKKLNEDCKNEIVPGKPM